MEFKIVVKGIVLNGKNLLIVRRSSQDQMNPGRISVPAGFVKFEEKPKEAVRREIIEEIGLDVDVRR
ncbi:MAG: NUDIX domain-containing protein, partial [Nanoarchaeota archaeon]|nr:NUDIX domain-containing protein [Nanoarchaeota archaeon]